MLWNYHQVKEFYKKKEKDGTWPRAISVDEVLQMMKQILKEEYCTKDDYIWEPPPGYDAENYDRAMRGI
jgi:hypothetical protein